MRRPLLLGVLVLCLIVASFVLGAFFAAPRWQQARESAKPIVVWAEVVERSVAVRFELPGVARPAQTAGLSVPLEQQPGIVTRPFAGRQLEPGGMIAEISGKPFFALPPPLALYRDLKEGDRGADILSLQVALSRAGFQVRQTGYAGAETLAATEKLFAKHSYRLPTIIEEIPAAVPAPASTPPPVPVQRIRRIIPHRQLIPTDGGPVHSSAGLGDRLNGDQAVVTVITAPPYVHATLPVGSTDELKVDDQVDVQTGGATTIGKISWIGPFEAGAGGSLPGHPVRVEVNAPGGLREGSNALISRSGAADLPAPAVPLTAVRSDAQGSYVLTPGARNGDPPNRVSIRVLRTADGWAAVEGVRTQTKVQVS